MKLNVLALAVAAVTFSASGCSTYSVVKGAVGSYGAEAADETVSTAIWTLCDMASTGAIKRKFQTEEQTDARTVICEIP